MKKTINNLTTITMLKKLLSLIVAVATLATSTALAITVDTTGSNVSQGTVQNFAMDKASFNPSNGETATVSFNLTENAEIYSYVAYPTTGLFVFANYASTNAGNVSYTFTGRVNNAATGAVLADGTYTVRAFARNSLNRIVGYGQTTVEVTSGGVVSQAPQILNLTVNPSSFNANGVSGSTVSFKSTEDAYVTVQVKASTGSLVKSFSAYNNTFYAANTTQSVLWNGRDDNGTLVSVGTYSFVVTARNSYGQDVESMNVTVAGGIVDSTIITNFTVDPTSDWDPSSQDMEIEYELTKDVKTLKIEAVQVLGGSKTIEILSDSSLDADEYTETWDGTDDNGNFINNGTTWNITITAITADNHTDVKTQNVSVTYDSPNIVNSFVTKSSFDPEENEFTNLVFKVNQASNVTVEVYKGAKKEFKLADGMEVKKNKWYAIKWDGTDKNGDPVDEGQDWKFKITAENSTDDNVQNVMTVDVNVESHGDSTKKAYITNDYTVPVITSGAKTLTVKYCVDQDTDVYMAIYKSLSASGKEQIELLDYVAQNTGCHEVEWNLTDKNGKSLSKDIYSYKIVTRTSGSNKETEIGRFVVGDGVDDVVPPTTCKSKYSDLGNLSDKELCDAIVWVTEKGIFSGYQNGTFQPYTNINRAEVLKTVLVAFNSVLLPPNGTTLGFSDVNPYEWYMTYVRTAQFYGMLAGYPDGTAGLSRNINRVEFLKFALEAAKSLKGVNLVGMNSNYTDADYSQWYVKYIGAAYAYGLYTPSYFNGQNYLHPDWLVQRGEVALLLYRLNKNVGFSK